MKSNLAQGYWRLMIYLVFQNADVQEIILGKGMEGGFFLDEDDTDNALTHVQLTIPGDEKLYSSPSPDVTAPPTGDEKPASSIPRLPLTTTAQSCSSSKRKHTSESTNPIDTTRIAWKLLCK